MRKSLLAKLTSLVAGAFLSFSALTVTGYAQNPFGSSNPLSINLPAVSYTLNINQPGSYTLGRDVRVANGDGIVITASGVTLDLNGRSITTGAPGTGRGIAIVGATGVEVKNGRVGGFMMNVQVMNSVGARVRDLRINGMGLAPSGGPSEIGVVILNSRATFFTRNQISNVNLGIFVRGSGSMGNRISENTVVGGAQPANNLFGICYNPAPNADAAVDGPSGDVIYNNHIVRFNFAIALSPASRWNIFSENTTSYFTGAFQEPEALVSGGGTNVSEGNLGTRIPMTILTIQ